MKKLYAALVAICLCLSYASVYALPDVGSDVAISQMNVIDYIILIGGGIFLIGLLFILLSMYAGVKNVDSEDIDEEENEDKDEDETIVDVDDEYVKADAEEVEEPNEEVEEPKNVDNDDAEPEIEQEEIIDEEPTQEEVAESKVYEEAEELEEIIDEPEARGENVVRITLAGINNADVKIVEFYKSATVGRRGTNDIMISDNAVSGEHCEFICEDGVVFLVDLDSTNGTFLNGEAITREEIKSGDFIILGKHQYKINIAI